MRRTFFAFTGGEPGRNLFIGMRWPVPYADFVDKGTSSHVVQGDMHWQPAPGIWRSSKKHTVAGITAQNFTERAKELAQDIIMQELLAMQFLEQMNP